MKYDIEKVIHRIIRDIPEVTKANRAYERGLCTPEELLIIIAEGIRTGKEKP